MPRPRKGSSVYWRNGRAWADCRGYSEVEGKREALIPDGGSYTTTDEVTPEVLVGQERVYSHLR